MKVVLEWWVLVVVMVRVVFVNKFCELVEFSWSVEGLEVSSYGGLEVG